MEVLESQARYRFGLIKKGEIYYQITPQNPWSYLGYNEPIFLLLVF
jgi:hypothetical protein